MYTLILALSRKISIASRIAAQRIAAAMSDNYF
jgi:hypothetical protein